MKKYAGIGSIKVPEDIGVLMTEISDTLSQKGYLLRSGGAKGSDTFFENGVKLTIVDGKPSYNKEIFKPFDTTKESMLLSSNYHSGWHHCNEFTRKLHGRNAMIVLGENLDNPVNFVVCWTENGKDKGGTGLGIRIAEDKGIKIYNLYDEETKNNFIKWLQI